MTANELVLALLDATEHYEADPRYARWDGSFTSFFNAVGLKPGLIAGAKDPEVRASAIDDAADAGWVRPQTHDGKGAIERKFALTAEGRRHARALREAGQARTDDAVDLSWHVLRGRLAAFVEAYERAGAPMQGLPLLNGAPEEKHLRSLLDAGFLTETPFGTDQQTLLRPSERALAVVRSWPSAQSIAREIVDEVAKELGQRDDPASSSAREALATGGRDLLVEITAAVIAKQSGLG